MLLTTEMREVRSLKPGDVVVTAVPSRLMLDEVLRVSVGWRTTVEFDRSRVWTGDGRSYREEPYSYRYEPRYQVRVLV